MNAVGTKDRGWETMAGATLRKLFLIAVTLVAPMLAAPAHAGGDAPVPAYGAVVTDISQPATRLVKLGLNKSVVVDLPRDARDVLVSNPEVANAVIRTSRRIYLTGVKIGQTNIIVFDRAGAQIISVELEVERDGRTLQTMLNRLIPGSNIDVEVVTDNIVLSGSVRNAADARRAQDLALIFANGGQNAQPGEASSASSGAGGTSVTIDNSDDVPLKIGRAHV